MFGKKMVLVLMGLALVQFPAVSVADILIMKNGKRIKTERAWTEGNQIKCYRFGSIIGYQKESVARIIKEEVRESKPPRRVKKKKERKKIDLAEKLALSRPPQNTIEEAANASVTVKTQLGAGAGFFITDDGYILTNRHVIEMDGNAIEKYKAMLEIEKQQLEQAKRQLKARKQFHLFKAKYEEAVRLHEKKRSELETVRLQAQYSAPQIILADETEMGVSVVEISRSHDLALLKLDGHHTPFLEPDNNRLAQGDTLYAVGSPLNLSHSVSSGVFSGYRNEYLQSNVQINQGNSGGPMITKEGKVVGINTWKMAGADIEGISFSIPIKTAINEFDELKSRYKTK
jgi:S1-C subfamily serine protease